MKIGIYDHSTGITEVRDMTEAEIAEIEASTAEALAKREAIAAKAAERVAVLAKLGLTAEEAAALFS